MAVDAGIRAELVAVRKVLEAAREGRVHKLLLAKGAEYQNLLGPLYPMSPNCVEGEQDLLNAAAVETIHAGGEVYLLDPLQLAGAGPIAAILRGESESGSTHTPGYGHNRPTLARPRSVSESMSNCSTERT